MKFSGISMMGYCRNLVLGCFIVNEENQLIISIIFSLFMCHGRICFSKSLSFYVLLGCSDVCDYI